jgi:hypothetical protein
MKIKRIAALLLAIMVTLTPLTQAVAFWDSADSGMSLQWANASTVTAVISLDGSTATCKATIVGKSGTTYIEADLRLYRQNTTGSWTLVDSWLNRSVSGINLQISEPHTVTSGTYKLTVDGEVTRNGTVETVSNSVERTVS